MRHIIGTAVVLSALIGGVASVSSMAGEQRTYTAEDIAKAKPVGTIEVEAAQLQLLLGGARGKGVLSFQGKKYPFSLKAVTVAGVGATKSTATGDVYFLKTPADFAGTIQRRKHRRHSRQRCGRIAVPEQQRRIYQREVEERRPRAQSRWRRCRSDDGLVLADWPRDTPPSILRGGDEPGPEGRNVLPSPQA